MGYLKSVGTSIIYIGAFLAAITFIPGIPPDAKFEEFSFAPAKELSNDFASNDRLNKPEILFKDQLKGPEAFASFNGELYTGAHGGYVIKVTDKKLVPIVKFGKECDGIWQEEKCGRPLGLKFDKKGALYVADAYYGIFKVDVKTGKYEQLVDSKKPIEGKSPKIINNLDITSNGDIYWTDSSTEFTIEDGMYTSLANPCGRLIRYNAATKKNEVLLHDLAFSNGVALSENEQFIIVSETFKSRVLKYNIKGPNAGKREIFVEQVPGLPDNIHSDGNNGFFVSLVVYGDSQEPILTQSLAPHPYIRRMLARLLALIEAPFKCLQSYYPNFYAEKAINYIGHFESSLLIFPKTVLILRLDNNGKIIEAAYNTNGNITGISSAYPHNGYLWLGSPFSEYIARVPIKEAFPKFIVTEKRTQSKVGTEVPKEEKKTQNTVNIEVPKEKKTQGTATPVPPKKVESTEQKKEKKVETPKKVEQKKVESPKSSEEKKEKKAQSTTSNEQKKEKKVPSSTEQVKEKNIPKTQQQQKPQNSQQEAKTTTTKPEVKKTVKQ